MITDGNGLIWKGDADGGLHLFEELPGGGVAYSGGLTVTYESSGSTTVEGFAVYGRSS